MTSNPANMMKEDQAALDTQVPCIPANALENGDGPLERARPVPRISIQVFCETSDVAECSQRAAEDRRLANTHFSIHLGGISAATAHYQDNPTPNLIVLETLADRDTLLAQLDLLADSCDEGTKVIVIGGLNDVILYRELLKRGVSEYLIRPVHPIQVMESISNLYNDPISDPVGKIYAFIGAKGGVGSSTVCHNASWFLAETLGTDVVVADLDLAFGTAGLDFNQDPVQGIADALFAPERLDEALLDRLLTKCSQHLSVFAAPALLDQEYDLEPDACQIVIDVLRKNVPYVSLDLPHLWTAWSKRLLVQSDEVIISAAPDLANLRNAKNVVDLLRKSRQHDNDPYLVLNLTNMPKRPELSAADFENALQLKVAAEIEFDAQMFGRAANNGQMISEVEPKSKSAAVLQSIALAVAKREDVKTEKKPRLAFLDKLGISI